MLSALLSSSICARGAAGTGKPQCEGGDKAAQVKLEFLLAELRQRCLSLDTACKELQNDSLVKSVTQQQQVRPELRFLASGLLVQLDNLAERLTGIRTGVLQVIADSCPRRIQLGDPETVDIEGDPGAGGGKKDDAMLESASTVAGSTVAGYRSSAVAEEDSLAALPSVVGARSSGMTPWKSEPGFAAMDVTMASCMFLRRGRTRSAHASLQRAASVGPSASGGPSLSRQRSRLDRISEGQVDAFAGCDKVWFADRSSRPVDLPGHLATDLTSDVELVTSSLRRSDQFKDLDEESIRTVAGHMAVYRFADGEDAYHQGQDSTHVFVVLDGHFVVISGESPIAELSRGDVFGNGVVWGSERARASVRARRGATVCGMSSFAMRRAAHSGYAQSREAVIDAVNVLQAGDCALLRGLLPFQTQCIHDRAELLTFEPGQVLPSDVVLVLCRGSASVRGGGPEQRRLGPSEVLGHAGALPEDAPEEHLAETAVTALALDRGLLDVTFKDKLPEALLRARLAAELAAAAPFAALPPERRREAAEKSFEVAVFDRLEFNNVCFVLCLSGEVQAEQLRPDGSPAAAPCRLSRRAPAASCSLGGGQLLSGEAWSVALAPGPSGGPKAKSSEAAGPAARLAVWRLGALDSIFGIASAATRGRTTSTMQAPAAAARAGPEAGGEAGGALKRVMVLRTLSQGHLGQLAELLEQRPVAAGEVVCRQGEDGHDCFIVRSGLLEIRVDGRLIRSIGPGDYIGERALIMNQPRSATVTALEDSDVWRMDRSSFEQVVTGPTLEYMKMRIGLQNTKISLDELKCLRKLGEGSFGVVKMVESTVTGMQYALKCVKISHAVRMKQQKHLVNERSILAELDHPFIIKYIRSFRDQRCIYFLMELIQGGDLLDFVDDLGRVLTWAEAQFYVGCLVLGLEFLHYRNIAYLDLKSDNCVIDHQGYIKLIDFGMAQRLKEGRLHGVKGTPLFMAPEVIKPTAGYTCAADLWSLGVTTYELVVGDFPFGDDQSSQNEIFKAVLKSPLRFPRELSLESIVKQLIKGLLNRDPEARLGASGDGFLELRNHGFFEGLGFSWEGLLSRQIVPPLVPDREFDGEPCEEGEAVAGPEAAEDVGFVDPSPAWQDEFS